jgi:6-phosphogluconolactonase
MKFGKVGQVVLVTAIALVVATLFTACGTLTIGFLYVATTKQSPGQIEVYEVNSESGALHTIPTSPFPSGGRNPLSEAVAPNYKNLYVANEEDNNIVQFGIGTDGKLYPQSTVNTPGTYPVAVAINSAGTFLYVIDLLQPVQGCTLSNSCPGDIAVYPINSDGSLGTAVSNNATYSDYWPLLLSSSDTTTVLTPTSINVLANGNDVYVTAYNSSTSVGYLFAFSTSSTGALTELNSGVPLTVGAEPVAMASDTGSQYLYVVDETDNQVSSFSVSSGVPSLIATAATGDQPSSLALFNDEYLYVANSLDSNVSAFGVSSGSFSKIGTYTSSTNPVAITVDPRNVGYLYTVNYLGSSLSGFKINQTDGSLINTQHSPYASSAQPAAISGIPHGGSVQ